MMRDIMIKSGVAGILMYVILKLSKGKSVLQRGKDGLLTKTALQEISEEVRASLPYKLFFLDEEFSETRLKFFNKRSDYYRDCIDEYLQRKREIASETILSVLSEYNISLGLFEKSLEKHKIQVNSTEIDPPMQIPEILTHGFYVTILKKYIERMHQDSELYTDFEVLDELWTSYRISKYHLRVASKKYNSPQVEVLKKAILNQF